MIEVRSSPAAAATWYATLSLVTFFVLTFSCVLVTGVDTRSAMSSEMAYRLAFTAVAVLAVLIPPFAVLYFTSRRKVWKVSERGIRVEEAGEVAGDWTWDDIEKVSLMPNGVSFRVRGQPDKEDLLFVSRPMARALFAIYTAKKIYLQLDRARGQAASLPK